jgi:tyrosyl-tRNA synthetase
MSISDPLMWRYIELLSFESSATVAKWKTEVDGGRNPREIKVLFAKEIVARFHSSDAARRAEEDFEARHRHGELPGDIAEFTLAGGAGGVTVTQTIKAAGLAPSVSEAQRLVDQGGVKVDGTRVSDRSLRFTAGQTFVLQVGKRKAARIRIS